MSDDRTYWLAAYALGLAVAGNLEGAVLDLSKQADGDAGLLDDARAHLSAMDIGDAASRRRAGQLLTDAATHVRRTLPPPG